MSFSHQTYVRCITKLVSRGAKQKCLKDKKEENIKFWDRPLQVSVARIYLMLCLQNTETLKLTSLGFRKFYHYLTIFIVCLNLNFDRKQNKKVWKFF